MRSKFNRELSQLNMELITMGALCEEAIRNAVWYLTDGGEQSKAACLKAEEQIDMKERDIETLCLKLILQQQPVAGDLRKISAALKMISDMERIGDQAADIVEIAPYVADNWVKDRTHIKDMAEATIKMVSESVEAFTKMSMDIAHQVIADDDLVDELFDKIKTELIQSITEGHNDTEALIDLFMIAKYFERIGDHAENIAEWVIFSITGKHEEQSPESE